MWSAKTNRRGLILGCCVLGFPGCGSAPTPGVPTTPIAYTVPAETGDPTPMETPATTPAEVPVVPTTTGADPTPSPIPTEPAPTWAGEPTITDLTSRNVIRAVLMPGQASMPNGETPVLRFEGQFSCYIFNTIVPAYQKWTEQPQSEFENQPYLEIFPVPMPPNEIAPEHFYVFTAVNSQGVKVYRTVGVYWNSVVSPSNPTGSKFEAYQVQALPDGLTAPDPAAFCAPMAPYVEPGDHSNTY